MIYRPDRWFNFDIRTAETTRNKIMWTYSRDCANSDCIPDDEPEPHVTAKQLPDKLLR